MSALNTTPYFQEPTRDEIAMSAFLAWEKDGRTPGRELHYWLSAEAQIRALRLKKAETTAAAAAKAAAKTSVKSTLTKPATSTPRTKAASTGAKPVTSTAPGKRAGRETAGAH